MQINRQTYEEFFLLYADGELSATDKKAVEDFVNDNADLAEEFQLVQSTVMQPDESIIFENKELLYRTDEDNRKVLYMRWIRFAAAAAVLLALTVAGWLFIEERNVTVPPVAIVEKPLNTTVEKAEQPANKTSDVAGKGTETSTNATTTGSLNSETALKKSTGPKNASQKTESHKNTINNDDQESKAQTIAANNADNVQENITPLQKSIDVPDVAPSETALSGIDMPVQAREVETEPVEQPVAQYAHSSYDAEPEKNDMIYFANTSLTKKTKLRGVLRKATRYLDRVTSLQ